MEMYNKNNNIYHHEYFQLINMDDFRKKMN